MDFLCILFLLLMKTVVVGVNSVGVHTGHGQAGESPAQMGITVIFSHQLAAIFYCCIKLIGMHRKGGNEMKLTDFLPWTDGNKFYVTFLRKRR